LPLFFASTLFVGSVLLFLLQPMVAKLLLPRLGGSPGVWTTCMLFFQALLLAGYAYAHALSRSLDVRKQAFFHLALLIAVLVLVLPIALPERITAPESVYPAFWLLGVLSVMVGLPFFVVSATSPLVQAWFAQTAHPSARDPYSLFAASNFGSLLALLSYPLFLEPALPLGAQCRLWAAGYVVLGALLSGCAAAVRSAPGEQTAGGTAASQGPEAGVAAPRQAARAPPLLRRLRWLALAFVPSSLMLSVTAHVTTDIAAVPLLWVLPLALYLLSFIIAFARRQLLGQRAQAAGLPRMALLLALLLLSEASEPVGLVMALHLAGLFAIALACHGDLARSRPAAARLTEFYLWLSAGGVLGGLFNSLVAPLVFDSVAEYPLVLVIAGLLQGKAAGEASSPLDRRLDLALPAALFALTAALVIGCERLGVEPGPVSAGLMFGLPVFACYLFLPHPLRFGLGLLALFIAGSLYDGVHGRILHRERGFFGVHRVTLDPEWGEFQQLVHGNIVHGSQRRFPRRSAEPLAYYGRSGPIGQIFEEFSGERAKRRVAVVGLGAGTLAAYGEEGQEWTYFEIDPAVERIARDERFFTFLAGGKAPVRVVLGDGRLALEKEAELYDLLVLDAFSSDAVPAHLLTREALRIYLAKLAGGGVLAFHVSSNHVDLEPVLGNLARDAGLVCRAREDRALSPAQKRAGLRPSHWVILARKPEDLGSLAGDPRWRDVPARQDIGVWTDDHHDLIRVFIWDRSD
jgi:hypothetical protein